MDGKEDECEVEEEKSNSIRKRFRKMKDYFLTYLECCYGAFIAVFIGIVAVPFLEISSIELRVILVLGFWIAGLYFLASIIYVYGQLWVAYDLSDRVDENMSQEIRKLGFPYNYLESIFRFLRKPFLGRFNAKYVGILVGYIGLLIIFLIIVLTD